VTVAQKLEAAAQSIATSTPFGYDHVCAELTNIYHRLRTQNESFGLLASDRQTAEEAEAVMRAAIPIAAAQNRSLTWACAVIVSIRRKPREATPE